jgi:hypothetical protein
MKAKCRKESMPTQSGKNKKAQKKKSEIVLAR